MDDNRSLLVRISNQQTPVRKSKCPELYEDILQGTTFLPTSAKIKERIYCIQHNHNSIPVCKHCNTNPVKFLGPSTGYRDYCSVKCSSNSEAKQSAIESTNLEKFGTKTPAQNKEIRVKTINTLEARYGAGVTCTQQNDTIRQKSIITNLEKYGSSFYTNSVVGIEKINQSHVKNHGVVRFTQSSQYKQMFKATCQDRYSRDHHKQAHIDITNLQKLNDPDWLKNQHAIFQKPQRQIAEELGVGPTLISTKFQEFGLEPLSFFQSTGERSLTDFLESNYNGDIQIRNKTIIYPYELDIWLPELNTAIEYNGIYWHSENNGKNRTYHLLKHELCKQNGVRLIQIYDIEWLYKTNISKSRLLHVLGNSARIFARQCVLREVSPTQKRKFLNDNHIQGDCHSSINIGLFYNGTLYSVMTFSKFRYGTKFQYELIRFANLINHSVVGGANKLFKHFIRANSPTSMVSYCDLRWGNGEVYKNLGMIQEVDTPPNYYYFKPNDKQLMSRQQFQKHKLSNSLPWFDPQLTEWENMKANGYYRIWNCGNAKFVAHFD